MPTPQTRASQSIEEARDSIQKNLERERLLERIMGPTPPTSEQQALARIESKIDRLLDLLAPASTDFPDLIVGSRVLEEFRQLASMSQPQEPAPVQSPIPRDTLLQRLGTKFRIRS